MAGNPRPMTEAERERHRFPYEARTVDQWIDPVKCAHCLRAVNGADAAACARDTCPMRRFAA